MVAQDKREREEGFGKVVEAASKEFRCGLLGITIIRGNQVETHVEIVAQD